MWCGANSGHLICIKVICNHTATFNFNFLTKSSTKTVQRSAFDLCSAPLRINSNSWDPLHQIALIMVSVPSSIHFHLNHTGGITTKCHEAGNSHTMTFRQFFTPSSIFGGHLQYIDKAVRNHKITTKTWMRCIPSITEHINAVLQAGL